MTKAEILDDLPKKDGKIQWLPDKPYHDVYVLDGRRGNIGIEVLDLTFNYSAPSVTIQHFKKYMIKKGFDWNEFSSTKVTLVDRKDHKKRQEVIFLYLETIAYHLFPYCGLKIRDEVKEQMRQMLEEVGEVGWAFRGDVKEKLEELIGAPIDLNDKDQLLYIAHLERTRLLEMALRAKSNIGRLDVRTTNLETRQTKMETFVDGELKKQVEDLEKTVREELQFISEEDLALIQEKIVKKKIIPLAMRQFPKRTKPQLFASVHGLIRDSAGLKGEGRRKLEKIPRHKTGLAIQVAWGIFRLLQIREGGDAKVIHKLDFGEGNFVKIQTVLDLMTEYDCWEDVGIIRELCSDHFNLDRYQNGFKNEKAKRKNGK